MRTIDQAPNAGELIKAAELIDISGAQGLSLYASRVYNRLLQAAHGPEMADVGKSFTVPLSELRGLHKGNGRIGPTLRTLQTTIVTAILSNGKTWQVQLLGGVDYDDESRPEGILTYRFDPLLIELLADSQIFAKLELKVLASFRSKYAAALYEAVCRRIRKQACVEEFTLEKFRDVILRVEPDKLPRYPQLNQSAIQPALLEVNALADFSVQIEPSKKQGKRVVSVIMGWHWKDLDSRKAAWAELRQPRVGRKARLAGTVEDVQM